MAPDPVPQNPVPQNPVPQDPVIQGYGTKARELATMLGSVISHHDADRHVIEPWAASISGRILDLGAGTGRWAGHLAALGHDVEGLEPVDEFVEIARKAHPGVTFRHASFADLADIEERWSGVLAWYSLIHLSPDELPAVLSTLRAILDEGGSLLASFFAGPRLETLSHPAATAYRWPMAKMIQALEGADFEITAQHWDPPGVHAHVSARVRVRNQRPDLRAPRF